MRRCAIIALLLCAALVQEAIALPREGGCETRVCAVRVHKRLAASCRSNACQRRACVSVSCRGRIEAARWHRLQAGLAPGVKAMLARLRGCETRGLSYPANYRQRGHHFGAYQYLESTWARAGGSGNPADASPAEQDVRTAWFYPGHRGEWSCRA